MRIEMTRCLMPNHLVKKKKKNPKCILVLLDRMTPWHGLMFTSIPVPIYVHIPVTMYIFL